MYSKSKTPKKVIMQDVWEEYREQADEIRHTPNWKEIYSQRKTWIKIYKSKRTPKKST